MRILRKGLYLFCLLALFRFGQLLQAVLPPDFINDIEVSRVSFDNATPDDSRNYLKVVSASPGIKYAPDGKGGRAWLFSGNETIKYQPVKPLFQGTGALSFWVTPQSWLQRGKVQERGYIVFLRAEVANGSLIVERQGFSENSKRRDYLLVLLNQVMTPMPLAVADSTEQWTPGQWHFITVNWDETGFAVSTDGQKLHVTKYSRPLKNEDFSGQEKFLIGTTTDTPAEQTLLDDVCLYKRPMTLSEIQALYKNGIQQRASATSQKEAGKKLSWDSTNVRSKARIPLISKEEAPVIDGNIQDEEWSGAFKVTGGYQENLRLDARRYFACLSSDREKVYIAICSELPPNGKLITNHQPGGGDNPQVGYDDSVEFWLLPDKDVNNRVYAIMLNDTGAFYDFSYDTVTRKLDRQWDSGIAVKSQCINGNWHVEAEVPAAALGLSAVKEGSPWGIRLIRNFNMPRKQVDWSPVSGAFVNPDTMGTVIWDNESPFVRGISLHDALDKQVQIMFEAVNPTTRDIALQIERYWEVVGNTDYMSSETVTLKPGERQTFQIGNTTAAGGEYHVILRADSPDGHKNFFMRKFVWDSRGSENAWSAKRSQSGADFNYGYYPYSRQIRSSLDLSEVADKGNIVSVSAALYQSDDVLILEKVYPAFRENFSEMTFTVPELPEGKYTLKAVAERVDGKKQVLEQGTFEQKHFSWEHNTLGISDQVIPPYEPLIRDGHSVRAVLRTYDLNNSGLPEQIRSVGQDLLAAPVSFRISVNDNAETVDSDRDLEFTLERPNEIHYQAQWHAGKLQGRTKAFFDYDGMLKLTVDFTLPESEKLSAFDLIIPIRATSASLMHVLSDTGKASVTGKVPIGANPVWESMFIEHNSSLEVDNKVNRFPGTFVPYIWLGDENRGICWFANNDKDWLPDDQQSVAEINRYADRTEIVIRFVTQPGTLKRTHSITFALQATPTKPMMQTPAHWRKVVFGLPRMEGLYHAAILGSAFHWGADDYFSFKPRQGDEAIFGLLKTARSGALPQDKLNAWMNGYDPGIPYLKTVTNGIRTGLAMAATAPQTIIPYTNMRGASVREEEFPIFKDEWLMGDYAPQKWHEYESGFGYCALACRSRQDFILWCLNRMLESGALDGIYYDVTYPKASRNTITGNAYYDDNGKLRTGCDLFESRELFKRSAVLTWQKRGYNLNVAHMSFTLIAPLHTWAGAILDWETRYGMEDFQDRFSREYIRTLSIGRQTGSVPLVLGSLGIQGKAELRPHVERTLTGVALTHEVKDWAIACKKSGVYYQTLKKLYDFGYGQPDCAVYNYWNRDFPVTVTGIDYSALALVRNGRMLLVLCEYGNGGNAELTLNREIGLMPNGTMSDAENFPIIPQNDRYSVPISKHDFKIIYYQ